MYNAYIYIYYVIYFMYISVKWLRIEKNVTNFKLVKIK